jgi:hypothetical protein
VALNKQIDVVHNSPNFKGVPREHVGMDNVEWAHEVVNKAVIAEGWHMKKVQSLMGVNELCDVELNKVFTEGGAFFIDGYLNQQYYRGPKKIKIQTSSTGKADRQRHSTAVVEYMVHDHPAFILGGSMSAANLWLDARATPNRKKGFMREFLRVYKVFKCTSKRKDTCKGNCCPVKKARVG